jgi:hypothetical protein
VTRGLIEAAQKVAVELHPLDNEFDSAKAIENARWMIKQRVDFAIECQRHAKIAPVLAEMFAKARIPTLAIDIPQPGALFFGVNNYSTGLMLGEAAGSFVLNEWAGCLDQVLVLEAFAPGLHLHSPGSPVSSTASRGPWRRPDRCASRVGMARVRRKMDTMPPKDFSAKPILVCAC